MSEDELPERVLLRVAKLRREGTHQRFVDRLLEKRAAGSPEERRKIDKTLIELANPNRPAWLLALLVLLVSGGLIAAHYISERRYEDAVAAGTPTLAQVKRMDDDDCISRGTNRCLRLALELHPSNRERYTVELAHDIPLPWMSRVQPGSWLTVSVDANDRSKVYFDEHSMVLPAPSPAVPGTGDSTTPM